MSAQHTTENVTPPRDEWEEVVLEQVKKLRFGVIQITIHDGRVSQIESTERTRLAGSGAVS